VKIGVILEDHGAPAMGEQMRRGRRLLENRAVRAEVAEQDHRAALTGQRHPEGANDVLVEALRLAHVVGDRPAVDREGPAMQEREQLLEDHGQAAGVEEILHQIFARRSQVDEERRGLRQVVEALERQLDAGAAGDRDEVDDRVGRSADGHVGPDRVVEGLGRENLRGLGPAGHGHLDRAPPGHLRHGEPPRVGRRDRRVARQRHPQRLGDRRHGRRSAHDHAVAARARHARFGLAELLVRQSPRAPLGPEAPRVGAGSELLVAPLAAEHGTARDHHGRHVGGRRAHQHGRRGLVAPREQHHGVQGIRANAFLDVHRHQVAEEHRRRFHEHFAERDRRKLEREATGTPHAALDGLGDLSEMGVAVRQLGPRIGDADDRPAVEDGVAESLGLEPRAMHESVEIVPAEPVAASERVCCHVGPPGHRL
jgi:hypothetical protein